MMICCYQIYICEKATPENVKHIGWYKRVDVNQTDCLAIVMWCQVSNAVICAKQCWTGSAAMLWQRFILWQLQCSSSLPAAGCIEYICHQFPQSSFRLIFVQFLDLPRWSFLASFFKTFLWIVVQVYDLNLLLCLTRVGGESWNYH